MRFLLLIALAGCGAKRPVVTWASTGTGMNERIEIDSAGHVSYTTTVNGVPDKKDEVVLSSAQVDEVDELFRSQKACELAHDPSFTPEPDEGQTTLVLAFPDQKCTVVLWNREWERGRAQQITETMRSMRPLRYRPGRVR